MNTMNRCLHLPTIRFVTMLVIALIWASISLPNPAAAQTPQREFPAAARRGVLEVTAPPAVLLNGMAERLSPGARIKGVNNMMVMSAALVGQPVVVNYLRDMQGLIHEVWILSAEEAREKRAGMAPVRNYVFGSDADAPKVDDGKTPFNRLPKYPGQ
jgi:hypothetical protein